MGAALAPKTGSLTSALILTPERLDDLRRWRVVVWRPPSGILLLVGALILEAEPSTTLPLVTMAASWAKRKSSKVRYSFVYNPTCRRPPRIALAGPIAFP